MAAFGLNYFLDDVACKLVFYFHRVAWGVSFGSISLLSIFQAITISPSNSRWVCFKVRAPKIISSSLGLCWALHMLANVLIPLNVTDTWSGRNPTWMKDFGCCAVVDPKTLTGIVHLLLLASTDVMCLALMLWAVVPWCFSCSGTSRGPNTFTGPGLLGHPLRPEPRKASLSW
jgi:vomeronasal1 receptor